MINDPAFAPWRSEAIKRGYASSIAFPLKTVAGTFGALTMYAKEPEHFNEREIGELAELADDVAFGISAIRLRAAHSAGAEELKKRAQELADTNTELEAFTYSASHDLRAPLRAMIGFSTFLQEDYADKLDEQAIDFLDRIVKGAHKMNQLIDDLLSLSRISRQEMDRTDVDLSAVAAAIIGDLQAAEPERDVTAAVQPSLMARSDQRLMFLALTNLLQNSWKYSRGAAPAVIQFGESERNGERVFYVKDNGAGFDMGFAERLFKPFQRLHSETEFEGTGIGLAIVERVIRRHGGRIWAEGEPGKGATFCFTLGSKQ
jgi:light-regulated signal transduction histidine kinase (bacteriophytochrome)